jgi:hypothetical protein
VLVPHAALQLLPGCIPPPAAFFLVEQLLREAPSPATFCDTHALHVVNEGHHVAPPTPGQVGLGIIIPPAPLLPPIL